MSLESHMEMRLTLRQYKLYLVRYLKPQVGAAAGMVASILLANGLALINPQVVRYFLDTAQAGGPPPALLAAASWFMLLALLQQGAAALAGYLGRLVGLTATSRLSADLALHCLRQDMTFHKQHVPGELIERIDGDATTLGNFFSQFVVRVGGNFLLVAGILLVMLRENPWVAGGMLLYILATLAVLGIIQRLGEERWEAQREASAELYGFLEERIGGVEEIRAAGAEAYTLRRLYFWMRNLLRKTRAAFVVSSLSEHLTSLVTVLGYSAGLAAGAILYTRGEVTMGVAYLIFNYVGMLSAPLQNIREQAADLQLASASLRRIEQLFSRRAATPDGVERLPAGPLEVELAGVDFRYEENDLVLRDLSFSVRPGRILGVLGRTGSGKSTLTRLLFRLYAPTAGSILLGRQDLGQVGLSDLRRKVGLVTQDVQLFQATLRENLTLFNSSISDERIRGVLRELGLLDWVDGLPGGLDTPMQSGGHGISAGEAQLLAFARVFLKDPGLVILDEASSRLDPVTEVRMERAAARLFAGRTGIIVAHRLKTVQRADDILILEDGRLVEYGPRQALAADPGSRFAGLLRTGLEEVLA